MRSAIRAGLLAVISVSAHLASARRPAFAAPDDAPHYMSEGARDAARELFNDPVFATTAVLGISAYLALWLAPEPLSQI